MKSKFFTVFISFLLLFVFFSNICNASINKTSLNSRFIFGFKKEKIDCRTFYYKAPVTEKPESGYPVIFLFHGAVQHGFDWFFGFNPWSYRQTQFTRKCLDDGYFVIAPSSLKPVRPGPRAWDIFSNDTKDVIFMEKMLEWVSSNEDLDIDNIYCAGFSSGGFMCSRVGHIFGNQIKAIAVNSGANADCIYLTNGPPEFDLNRTYDIKSDFPPTIIIHGEQDGFVPVEAANLFYDDLQRCGIFSEKHINPDIGHIWLTDYENLIFEFFSNQ